MNLFKIFGTIAVNNSEANAALDQTTDKAKSASSVIGGKLSAAGNKLTSVGKALAPISAGVVAVGAGLVGLAKKTASTADNIDKMSQKLGISRTAYQEWDYILSQNGASIDSLKTGMKTLNNTLDKVNQAGDTAGTAFERLGLSYDDLKGKSKEEIFDATIKALQNCQDETERTKLATELFGRAGVDLAPLLNQGAEATDELRKRAHELGLILDDETVDAGVKMTDAMDTMKRSFTALGASISVAVMPYVTKFCDYVSRNMPKAQKFVRSLADRFNQLSPSVKKLIAIVAGVTAAASPALIIGGKILTGVGSMINGFGRMWQVLNNVISSAGGLSAIFGALTSPIGLVVIAIGALIAIFAVLYTQNEEFRNKVNIVWNQVKTTIGTVVTAIRGLIQAFVDVVKAIWDRWGNDIIKIATTVFTGIFSTINAQLKVIRAIIQTVTALIKGDWKGVWDGIKNIISSVWNLIKTIINAAMNVIKTILQTGMKLIKSIIAAAWDAVKTVFSTVWNGIKTIVSSAINAVRSTIENVLGSIKSGVTSKVNDIKSAFTSKFEDIKSNVTSKMDAIKSAVTSKISEAKSTAVSTLGGLESGFKEKLKAAKEKVDEWVDKIKDKLKFPSWSIPKPKVPKVTISGGTPPYGIGGKGSLPVFHVDWARRAMANPMLFTGPTIYGINPLTGHAKGAGEAGDEMMYGHANLMADIKQAVSEGNEHDAAAAVLNLIYRWLTRGGFRRLLIDVLTNCVTFEFENREVARVVERYAR